MPYVLTVSSSASKGNVGWSFLLSDGTNEQSGSGKMTDATAYRGAIQAAVSGLALLATSQEVHVRTSNETLANAGERWIQGWRSRDWDKKGGIKHLDLIKQLSDHDVLHRLHWTLHSSREAEFRAIKEAARVQRLSLPAVVESEERSAKKSAPSAGAAQASMRTVAYTDGGCRGNPGGVGGWGMLLIDTRSGQALERWGAVTDTTNNRMEMQAALEALTCLRGAGRELEIRTDSKYLADMATTWIHGWRSRGWQRGKDQSIANLDLVKQLDALQSQHRVLWTWVKGHRGEPGNEHVDALATKAMDAITAGEPSEGQERYAVSPVSVAGPS